MGIVIFEMWRLFRASGFKERVNSEDRFDESSIDGIPTLDSGRDNGLNGELVDDARFTFGDLKQARKAAEEVVSLPMHPYMDEGTFDTITTAILDHF